MKEADRKLPLMWPENQPLPTKQEVQAALREHDRRMDAFAKKMQRNLPPQEENIVINI